MVCGAIGDTPAPRDARMAWWHEATPFKRYILKELSEACQRQGLRFGFYYSQAQDWHQPGDLGNSWDKSIKRVSSDEYVREKAHPEVAQLLTEYGPLSIEQVVSTSLRINPDPSQWQSMNLRRVILQRK